MYTVSICKTFISNISEQMDANKQTLTDMDAALGDGDLGLTMSQGFSKAKEAAESFEDTDIGKFFMKIGMTLAQAVPSTMGTLLASGFMEAAKALKGKTEFGISELKDFADSFYKGIANRGKASPGDRTILDSLYPACLAIEKAVEENKSLKEASALAYEAAISGVEATQQMKAKFGRAVFYGEKVLGIPDQGATAGMYIYKALANTI